ncbi:MAG TPA: DUF3299 domain-containing protein [Planctomycetota bacterium]|nr:DUF3299 domain-containing protein [Planctomycetota bacterium]
MSNPNKGSDILIAVGAVVFIALGASVTYWLTQTNKPQQSVVVNEGAPIDPGKNAAPAAAAQSQSAPVVPVEAKSGDGDFLPVTFSTLSSYYYELPSADDPVTKTAPKDQIPQPIKSLNGKKVAIQGFMVPTDLKNGKTTRFLLVKDQSLCCFGRMPRMNEWVSVTMKPGKAARVIQDQPVTVFGNIAVGEDMDKGEVLSIYRVDSEDVAGPLDL